MRLPRPTTRRLMAAVAVVALLLGACVLGSRTRRYQLVAADWAAREFVVVDPPLGSEADRKRADYVHAMRLKYERAAWRPWLSVPPDPPPPE